jgi:hypothetical protein
VILALSRHLRLPLPLLYLGAFITMGILIFLDLNFLINLSIDILIPRACVKCRETSNLSICSQDAPKVRVHRQPSVSSVFLHPN